MPQLPPQVRNPGRGSVCQEPWLVTALADAAVWRSYDPMLQPRPRPAVSTSQVSPLPQHPFLWVRSRTPHSSVGLSSCHFHHSRLRSNAQSLRYSSRNLHTHTHTHTHTHSRNFPMARCRLLGQRLPHQWHTRTTSGHTGIDLFWDLEEGSLSWCPMVRSFAKAHHCESLWSHWRQPKKEGDGQELGDILDPDSQALPYRDTHQDFYKTSHGTLFLPQGNRK